MKIILAIWMASSLACGFGGSHEVLDALQENGLQYRSKYIDRFPDWEFYLAVPASPQQWEAVKQRLRLDQDWQRLESMGGWVFPPGEPAPDWWMGADAPTTYWTKWIDKHCCWSIKYVNEKVYFMELKS